jgi:RHS repeat-associated protein
MKRRRSPERPKDGPPAQVTQANNTTESYSYDAVGNRTASLGVSSYTTNASNELTATSNASYTYDSNGNTLTKTVGSNTTAYAWDYENRLTSVTLPGTSGTVTFKYDPFGRRVEKSSSAATSVFAYDDKNPIEETNASGAVMARYTGTSDEVDQPLAMLRSGATSYYEQDGLDAITSLSNTAGALAQTYTFDSFGKQTASSGSLTNPFQYTAREFDPETSLYYYRARYYDETLGRFITEDPIEFIGGYNFYRYVYNSPAGLNDPWGLAASVAQVQARCLKCTKNLTDKGQRLSWDSNNTMGKEIIGWANDITSWFTKHKACWDQALSVEECLDASPLDGWSFSTIPVRGGFHHVVRGHDNQPNDPDVICDPWRNETYPVPRSPGGF